MEKTSRPSVASQAKYIYYYVVVNIVGSIVTGTINYSSGQFKKALTPTANSSAAQLSTQQTRDIAIASVAVGLLLTIALDVYLVKSSNVKATRIWLTVLLVFLILGILLSLSHFNVITFIVTLITASFLGMALRQVRALEK